MNPNIVIYGAGAVGGYVGGYLTRDGHTVTLVDPWVEHVQAMREPGLILKGLTEPECFQIAVNALTPDEYLNSPNQSPVDIGIISTKSYDTETAAHFLKPLLAPDGFVVSLQNCINEPAIAAIVGEEKTVGCIASTITVGLYTPGLVQRNVPRRGAAYTVFRCGEYGGGLSQRVQDFATLLAPVDSARATDNLMGERWTKLVINTSRNGILAATGMETAAMELDQGPRRLCIRTAAETIRVAQALQVKLEDIGGFAPSVWVAAAQGDAAALESIESDMLATAKTRVAGTQLSMGQDIEKGRRTEIDYLNGLVVEKGRAVGIDTPANEIIWQAVRRVENGEVKPAMANIAAGF
ncbi:MAG: 2-dehydropantoate 2-reductase [Burkholderiaceae bacterium]